MSASPAASSSFSALDPIARFSRLHQLTGAREAIFPALVFHAAQMRSKMPEVRHVALEIVDPYGDVTLHGPFARFAANECAWLASTGGIRHEDNLIQALCIRHSARVRIVDVPAHALDKSFLELIPAFMQAFPEGRIDTLVPDPVAMSEDDFLCGADSADPWCRQSFEDYIEDIDTEFDPQTLVEINDRYLLAESSDSVLLLHKNQGAGNENGELEVVGYYNTPGAVCIREDHQGQGLGAELILHTYQWCGAPPTEGLDEQMFSEAGLAAHRKAYALGLERGIFVSPSFAKIRFSI